MKIEPMVLEGEAVNLEPLGINRLDELYEAASDESLWVWTMDIVKTKVDLRRYVETALEEFKRGFAAVYDHRKINESNYRLNQIWKYRREKSEVGNRLDMDKSTLAANAHQHGSEIFDAESRF